MTTPGSTQSERVARQEFVRDRQRMVIIVTIGLLIVGLVVSSLLLISTSIFKKQKTAADLGDNFGVVAPCLPDNSTTMDFTQINVRVLNATKKVGIATAVSKALALRGFVTQAPDDFTAGNITRTQIRFGKEGIVEAYTLYTQFNDAVLVMDDRSDKLVDVAVASTFNNLNSVDATTSGSPLKSISGCIAPDKMTNLPPAQSHDPVN